MKYLESYDVGTYPEYILHYAYGNETNFEPKYKLINYLHSKYGIINKNKDDINKFDINKIKKSLQSFKSIVHFNYKLIYKNKVIIIYLLFNKKEFISLTISNSDSFYQCRIDFFIRKIYHYDQTIYDIKNITYRNINTGNRNIVVDQLNEFLTFLKTFLELIYKNKNC